MKAHLLRTSAFIKGFQIWAKFDVKRRAVNIIVDGLDDVANVRGIDHFGAALIKGLCDRAVGAIGVGGELGEVKDTGRIGGV